MRENLPKYLVEASREKKPCSQKSGGDPTKPIHPIKMKRKHYNNRGGMRVWRIGKMQKREWHENGRMALNGRIEA